MVGSFLLHRDWASLIVRFGLGKWWVEYCDHVIDQIVILPLLRLGISVVLHEPTKIVSVYTLTKNVPSLLVESSLW